MEGYLNSYWLIQFEMYIPILFRIGWLSLKTEVNFSSSPHKSLPRVLNIWSMDGCYNSSIYEFTTA